MRIIDWSSDVCSSDLNFTLLQLGEEGTLVEVARLDDARAAPAAQQVGGIQALHDRGHVVGGIAVRQVAADAAEVAHLRIGEEGRRLLQDRAPGRSADARVGQAWGGTCRSRRSPSLSKNK